MKTATAPSASYPANPYKVGDRATVCGYSDRQSYTVIAVTRTSITLQRNKATLLNGANSGEPDALVVTPGGFCCHTEGEQRYLVEVNPEGHIIKAHMKRKPRKVLSAYGTAETDWEHTYEEAADFRHHSSRVVPGCSEYYDFNF